MKNHKYQFLLGVRIFSHFKPKWPKTKRDVQSSWIWLGYSSSSHGVMVNMSGFHLVDPGLIPSEANFDIIFSVKKSEKITTPK